MTEIDKITSLAELFAAIRAGYDGDWTDLPVFGGDDPADTRGIWSWDAAHLIVGTCADDIEIVTRTDYLLSCAIEGGE